MRLDIYIYNEFSLKSREYARSLIKNGDVFVGGVQITKAGYELNGTETVSVNDSLRYVGRGGLKLERALDIFNITADGKTALDIGASTGGFTDCLLQHGAVKVFAVDVGHGQLAEKLVSDPRVINLEGVHIDDLMPETVGKVRIITADVSFISLRRVIPKISAFCDENADIICLFKPQFEYGKKVKNGVIKDEKLRLSLLDDFIAYVPTQGFSVIDTAPSPISGGDGNKEFLVYLRPLKDINL